MIAVAVKMLTWSFLSGIYILDSLSNGHPPDVFRHLEKYVGSEFKRQTGQEPNMAEYKQVNVKVCLCTHAIITLVYP
jgi:hypothetical protein